jgi:hypothetical protein
MAAGFHHVTVRCHIAPVVKLTKGSFFKFLIIFQAAVNRG